MSAKKRIKFEEVFEGEQQQESSEMMGVMEKTKIAEVSSQQIVKGRVTHVSREFITIDIGFKSEGRVPVAEFVTPEGDINVKAGDEISVFVSNLDSRSGNIIMSKTKADAIATWEKIEDAYTNKTAMIGTVTAMIKGGAHVDLGGLTAFMPLSQCGDAAAGRIIAVKISEYNDSRSNIIVSRKAVFEEEKESKKKDLLPKLKEGAVFDGVVKRISDYGVFVDIGGMDGMVHVSDLSWGRVKNPRDVISTGTELKVVVLKYDVEKEKLSLGVKQLTNDPWVGAKTKYSVGDRVKGKIVSVTDFGAFMEVEPGIEGMIHISEMSWAKKIKKPNQLLKVGDVVETVILDIDTEKKKMGLGLKQIGGNPWDELKNKYPYGTRVKGTIKSITDFGLFVNIGEEFDGLVRIADITWDAKAQISSKDFKKGAAIDVVVIDVDVEKQRLSLGIKQLTDDPWKTISERYPAGRSVEGTIVKVTDFGIFVELEPGVDGLIHIKELSDEKTKKINKEQYKEGDKITSLVTKVDRKTKKISLSLKAMKEKEERDNVNDFVKQQGDVKTSLGDILRRKLNG
ncbi:MAG: 30S ribosomal protein S1 [Pseudomonadota bacterium]